MRRPFMPFFVGDYHADTQHLETAQHGAYLLLILHYWANGELPDDEKQLAKITKLPLHSWRQMQPTLQHFFHDGWKHNRIDAELTKADDLTVRRKIAGSKGGTRAAIARFERKQLLPGNSSNTTSKRVANAVAKLQQATATSLITSSSSVAARGREQAKTPANSNNAVNQASEETTSGEPVCSATFLSETQQKNPDVSRSELVELCAAKGWLKS